MQARREKRSAQDGGALLTAFVQKSHGELAFVPHVARSWLEGDLGLLYQPYRGPRSFPAKSGGGFLEVSTKHSGHKQPQAVQRGTEALDSMGGGA